MNLYIEKNSPWPVYRLMNYFVVNALVTTIHNKKQDISSTPYKLHFIFKARMENLSFFFSFWTFYFCIGVELVNNVVIISGEQWRGSVIHMHVFILPKLLSSLAHHTEQSSMCCIIGPCWLSILNIAVCTYPSQTPQLSLPHGNSMFVLQGKPKSLAIHSKKEKKPLATDRLLFPKHLGPGAAPRRASISLALKGRRQQLPILPGAPNIMSLGTCLVVQHLA